MCTVTTPLTPPPCRTSYAPLLGCINGTTSSACNSTARLSYPLGTWYTLLSDHTATNLPQTITQGYGAGPYPGPPESDYVMTQFPFWKESVTHWAVAGQGNRWEVDDQANNGCE